MFQKVIPIIQHPHALKIWSLVLGYSIWYCVAQHQTITQHYQAPILFFDTNNMNLSTQDSVEIILQGSRQDMHYFNPDHAAIHIDSTTLRPGQQEIMIDRENLFLPDTIKLVDLIPSHISINAN
ncbi:hypothetical protein KBD08_01665 [Candidatus Babeliales bacterium]|nr:hypothetical protein [Candidatus Babeliales bacterium]